MKDYLSELNHVNVLTVVGLVALGYAMISSIMGFNSYKNSTIEVPQTILVVIYEQNFMLQTLLHVM